MTGVIIKRHTHTRRRTLCDNRDQGELSPSLEKQEFPEIPEAKEGHGVDSPLELSEKARPCPQLDIRLLPRVVCGKVNFYYKLPNLRYIFEVLFHRSPRKLI